MNITPLQEKKYIKNALKDERLRFAVFKSTETAVESRKKAVSNYPYWEDLRYKTHSIKKEVLDHLDTYLEQFEKNCAANGIQIHWAETPAEAQNIILDVINKNDVKNIVKSKSLTTEEINLNSILGNHGIQVLETDLGEYIVQLLGQIPSHLTMPAMHLRRNDIGKIFHEKLGVDYTEDPQKLMQIARRTLRNHFLKADMGITGANFGIADTGCICVLENEANAHLTATLPRIHLAVLGIEKILPDLQSLSYFLKVLGPSATGQLATSYVNLLSGPLIQKYGEGPEQVHIVLLDNGRSNILRDPKLRETLFCIRCGACLNICPVYKNIGGHAYGWVYMGPIGITLIPQYLGEVEGRYAPFLSSLCGACAENCPVRIQLPHHILTMRNRIVEAGKSNAIERIGMGMWAFLAKRPKLYRFFTWFPGKLQLLLPKQTVFPVPGYTKERSFSKFDTMGFRKRFYARTKTNADKR